MDGAMPPFHTVSGKILLALLAVSAKMTVSPRARRDRHAGRGGGRGGAARACRAGGRDGADAAAVNGLRPGALVILCLIRSDNHPVRLTHGGYSRRPSASGACAPATTTRSAPRTGCSPTWTTTTTPRPRRPRPRRGRALPRRSLRPGGRTGPATTSCSGSSTHGDTVIWTGNDSKISV
jgi:hypothetical protein